MVHPLDQYGLSDYDHPPYKPTIKRWMLFNIRRGSLEAWSLSVALCDQYIFRRPLMSANVVPLGQVRKQRNAAIHPCCDVRDGSERPVTKPP
jgi:hypothetical protein